MTLPITIDEFKLFFLREAGLEYQPYPNWDEGAEYSQNDCVLHIVNYKVKAWKAKSDNINQEPSASSAYWDEIEVDLDGVVLDSDIERAMGEATFKYNDNLFPDSKKKMIALYLTMFFLVYDRQNAESGLTGSTTAGPVTHRTVGKMSVTYMESKLFDKNPSYEFYASNGYGKKAFQLMAPYLRGTVITFNGSNTGE